MENHQEVWRDIEIEGLYKKYAISNLGRIKRLPYVWVNKGKQIPRPEKLIAQMTTKNGYKSVWPGRKSYLMHRLVALAFIPNPDSKPFVNHINCIKSDNRMENLEWCTKSENQRHAWDNNLFPPPHPNFFASRKKVRPLTGTGRMVRHNGIIYKDVLEASEKTGYKIQAIYAHVGGYVKEKKFEYVGDRKKLPRMTTINL